MEDNEIISSAHVNPNLNSFQERREGYEISDMEGNFVDNGNLIFF